MSEHHEPHPLVIEGDMNIYVAAQLKDQLLGALADTDEVRLDLSQVGDMDSAGFQVLYLAKREALRQGKNLRITAHSSAVREALEVFNMVGYFGDPLLITARETPAH